MLSKQAEFKYNKMKKLKWEYYTGKLDDDQLKKLEWEPFPYILKSDLSTYLDSDEDLNKYIANKAVHDEIVELCTTIMKELNSANPSVNAEIAAILTGSATSSPILSIKNSCFSRIASYSRNSL